MNKLFYGDNLEILRDEKRMPSESVDLCYIDPPFNSQRNYNQIYSTPKKADAAQTQAFTDTWTWDTAAKLGWKEITENEGGRYTKPIIELFLGLKRILEDTSLLAYLVSITLRLVEIRRILKPTGSFYLHCDPTASHYLKIILDSIFGPEQFRSDITWKRANVHSDSKDWSAVADTLLYYVVSSHADFVWNPIYLKHSEKHLESKYTHRDSSGRRYMLDNMRSPNPRPNLTYEWKGYKPHPNGWAYSRETMARLDAEGRIWYPNDLSKKPRLKRYLDETRGTLATNIWTDISPINSQAQERMGYPTQKPKDLLKRIIEASSNEGNVVLDAYCGCGTTVAVAQELNRQWIGIDITYQSISLILQRLEDHFGTNVVKAIQTGGIPADVESARALAERPDDPTRKEFEKWAVLTFTNNRAVIRLKKGADKGIDGILYFDGNQGKTERAVLQAKSGAVKRSDIATLRGDMQREEAVIGFLLTLEEPTKPMREEAAQAGLYHHVPMGMTMNSIQIVTIREMLEQGKRSNLPRTVEVVKKAPNLKQQSLY